MCPEGPQVQGPYEVRESTDSITQDTRETGATKREDRGMEVQT